MESQRLVYNLRKHKPIFLQAFLAQCSGCSSGGAAAHGRSGISIHCRR